LFVEQTSAARHGDLMFDNFVGTKVEKRRQRTRTIAFISVAVHAAALLGLLVRGFWQIERLGMPKREITLAVAAPLEVPAPPAAPSVKRTVPDPTKVRIRPQDATQPVNRPVDETLEVEIVTEEMGSNVGVVGGSSDSGSRFPGIGDGRFLPNRLIEAPPPAPVAPKQPPIVAPTVVEAQRIAGQKLIQPDDGTKLEMARDGRPRVEARVKMCLSASGDVARTSLVHSSGYPGYDAIILATMQAWKYRPYLVNAEATAVCTQVTFIYSQR
jgi:TonB family protein